MLLAVSNKLPPRGSCFSRSGRSHECPDRSEIVRRNRDRVDLILASRFLTQIFPLHSFVLFSLYRNPLTSCAKIATLSQFQIYLNVAVEKQMISLLPLDNFCPVISYRRVENERKATNYCIRLGVTRYGPQSVASARG